MLARILSIILLVVLSFSILPTNILAQTLPDPNDTTQIDPATANANAPGWREEPDPEVTFVGKNVVRSQQLLDWVIANYEWSYVADGLQNPFVEVWVTIRNIVYALLTLGILVAAFIIIITRGENLGIRQFIVRLVMVIVLITLSFAIVQFIYIMADVIQGFFIYTDGVPISAENLLKIGFSYDFKGYRNYGVANDESAVISLLLVKLTAATYYAMFGVLMLRKVILWFFILVSPVFPLLLLFTPLRNTAKLWLGEFFRWVLYAPLFAIFLSGLVAFWANWGPGTPLKFDYQTNPPANLQISDAQKIDYTLPCANPRNTSDTVYPTSINILLGGPCQAVDENNSLSVPASFIQYVVALMMLWMVIILPFILLKIFIGYFKNNSIAESSLGKLISQNRPAFLERYGIVNPKPTPSAPPFKPAGTGQAMAIPTLTNWAANEQQSADQTISNVFGNQVADSNSQMSSTDQTTQTSQVDMSELTKTLQVSMPSMTDIARLEAGMMSRTGSQESTRVSEALNRLSGTSPITTPAEREQFTTMRETVIQQAQSGDAFATAVLSASQSAANSRIPLAQQLRTQINQYHALSKVTSLPNFASFPTDQKYTQITQNLTQEAKQGNLAASAVLAVAPKQVAKQAEFVKNYQAVAQTAQSVAQNPAPDEQKVAQLRQSLGQQAKSGNTVATSLLTVIALSSMQSLPNQNALQQVNLAEFEQVKKTWAENYRTMDVPDDAHGGHRSRQTWLTAEAGQIPQVIAALQSADPKVQQHGMQQVSQILPFLLLGGFSKAEVSSYLKAKQEAAQQVLAELAKDNNKVLVERQATAQKTMTAAVELPTSSEASAVAPTVDPENPPIPDALKPHDPTN